MAKKKFTDMRGNTLAMMGLTQDNKNDTSSSTVEKTVQEQIIAPTMERDIENNIEGNIDDSIEQAQEREVIFRQYSPVEKKSKKVCLAFTPTFYQAFTQAVKANGATINAAFEELMSLYIEATQKRERGEHNGSTEII